MNEYRSKSVIDRGFPNMKNALIVIGICLLFIGMPVGLSDCGCDQTAISTSTPQQQPTPWLTSQDITALQEQGQQEGWTFTVAENTATQRPLNQLCGLVVPDNWWVGASFDPCTPTRDLPQRFDWRELGGCTSIKDQGNCGSCWAFGTVGALECNILIHDHKEVDLSEQWLVSCNTNGWSCNGGWWAHDYFQSKKDRSNGTGGAVLEQDFPYEATNLPCKGPYPHPYHIDSWHFVGWSQGVPSPDSIKQAIMTYGPISVAIAVTRAFGGYNGGVFNANDPNATINHAVVLVGWDDNQGTNGVWFLRNSWGPNWGEDGYMRIEYGVCKVGYAACYVDYPPRTIVDIKGGILGPTLSITNVGNRTTSNIDWKLTMKGGVRGLINISLENTIPELQPGAALIRRIPRFGFGPVTIDVTVTPSNAGKVVKHVNTYLFGFFLLTLPEK